MNGSVAARSGYRVVPYQYYARTGSGHTPSRSVEEYWQDCTIPWITTGDVKHLRDGQQQVLHDTEFKLNERGVANSAARVHPAGTVALSRTASVGFAAIMGRPMATSQDFVTWSPGPDLEPRYLLWVLRAMKGAGDFDRLMHGSTHKTIYVPDLQQMRGPLPPIEVQRRVADYLDTETARIDSLQRRVSHLRRLVHERRLAWLGSSVDDMVEARWAPLWTVARSITSGPRDWGDYVDESGVRPFVRIGNIQRDWFALDTTALLFVSPPKQDGQGRRVQLDVGDLVVSITADIGSVGVVDEAVAGGAFNQHVARVRLDQRRVEPFYAAAALRTVGRPQFARLTAGGAKQGLSLLDVGSVRIPVPTLARQRALVAKIEVADSATLMLLGRLETERRLLEVRRRTLITAAVTGEWEI